eukprot:403364813
MVSIDQDIVYPEKFNQYEKVEELGAGTYGKVFLYKKKGQEYAIKFEIQSTSQALLRESVFMYKFSSDKAEVQLDVIPRYIYHSTIQDQRLNYLIMERLHLDLNSYYQDKIKQQSKEKTFQELLTQCIEALRKFHEIGYVHRDIKPGNIMMRNDQPVLIDFGISQEYKEDLYRIQKYQNFYTHNTIPGTIEFVSLKMHENNQQYGPLDDLESLIYSFYYIVNNKTLPWFKKSPISQEIQSDLSVDEVKILKQILINFEDKQSANQDQGNDQRIKQIKEYFEMNPLINKCLQQTLKQLQQSQLTNQNIDPYIEQDSKTQEINIDQQNSYLPKSQNSIYDQLIQLISNFNFNEEIINDEEVKEQIIITDEQKDDENLRFEKSSVLLFDIDIQQDSFKNGLSTQVTSTNSNTENDQWQRLQFNKLDDNHFNSKIQANQQCKTIDTEKDTYFQESRNNNIQSNKYKAAEAIYKDNADLWTTTNNIHQDDKDQNGKGRVGAIFDSAKKVYKKITNKGNEQVKVEMTELTKSSRKNIIQNFKIEASQPQNGRMQYRVAINYQNNYLVIKFENQKLQIYKSAAEQIQIKFEWLVRNLTREGYETLLKKLNGNIGILKSQNQHICTKEDKTFQCFISTINAYYELNINQPQYSQLMQSSAKSIEVTVHLNNLSNKKIQKLDPIHLFIYGDLRKNGDLFLQKKMKRWGDKFTVNFCSEELKNCENGRFAYKFFALVYDQGEEKMIWSNDKSKPLDYTSKQQNSINFKVNKICR